jgi:shikimate kinase
MSYCTGVDASRKLRNIALVGFMGTGKTSVGRALAALLHFRLLDTDRLIEIRARKRIQAIFADEGEARFREYEKMVVEELAHQRRTVISTGGGLVVDPANLASLKTHALIVCLWASPEVIFARVRRHSYRPLLQAPDPLGRIQALLAEREPAYRQADVLVNTELRSVKEVALHVAHHFRLARAHLKSREECHPTSRL